MQIPDGWSIEEGGKALLRTVRFQDFSEAFAFLTRVALLAEKADHHPEFTSVWNRVDFRLTSHDAGKVTERDIALAKAINVLALGCAATDIDCSGFRDHRARDAPHDDQRRLLLSRRGWDRLTRA
jgi:4a-hydroxytetrahydrobiopterin dehydratase